MSIPAATAEAAYEPAYGDESGLVQILNEARCLSKRTVGNRELARRIMDYLRAGATAGTGPALTEAHNG